jgi:hypothetical protein
MGRRRPCVPAKISLLLFCSRSNTGTAGMVPRLKAAQVLPASVLRNTPMSVPASTVLPLASLLSTSIRVTGMSGSGDAPPAPSARVQLAPKVVVRKMCPTPVEAVNPERLRKALLALLGSGEMPVA